MGSGLQNLPLNLSSSSLFSDVPLPGAPGAPPSAVPSVVTAVIRTPSPLTSIPHLPSSPRRDLPRPVRRGCLPEDLGALPAARHGLNGHSVSPWQVPWFKQRRSPVPSHARSQPGLCTMYQVRRVLAPPGPSRPPGREGCICAHARPRATAGLTRVGESHL